MSSRHTIRLRGPWQYEVLERLGEDENAEGLPPRGRIKLPVSWEQPPWENFFGRVRFLRNFNWPEPLEPHERLDLVFDVNTSCVLALLDGGQLVRFEGAQLVRVEVTSLVKVINKLAIEAERTEGDSPDFVREVYLEVSGET